MIQSTIVEVYAAANVAEANLVKAMLADAGIEARVVGDLLNAAAGGVPFGDVVAPRVWVVQEDATRARRSINEWKSMQPERVEREMFLWKCSTCGEEIEGTLEVCWKCGTSQTGEQVLDVRVEESRELLDEETAGKSNSNPRVISLSILLLGIALGACGFVGASVLLLIIYGMVSGLFSAIVGGMVSLVVPVRDERTSDV
jgi:hypothetical protein